ncbi:hypothetical protein A3A93_00790 [Candidatus Roizmanbacteria bacterium RIFCSPLOWO2_01_FULL_38_12]|uniref:UDP-N-acetyl-alpha-D-muramoyl-L-alanyl-L-glutamate epimerase n=1 Tax=Candidatus Roizmanbacteria bacterium RIFCSPLOWO2_01_FULL_38_12 TaxID=1802061 RepID=A0A1F7IVK8_9BACT|nr:MAG: hypothetical protein A3A93_00790 [Candidatus Roizmanbacteria bacterium RIFCSPLOWO2_01_FULL_38_12]
MQDLQFIFSSFSYNSDKLEYSFNYEIEGDKTYKFTEKIILPFLKQNADKRLLDRILFSLHLVLGISYWKTFCPRKILIKSGSLSKKQAKFWNELYTKGLGEFFYKNKIDYRGLIQFPFDEDFTDQTIDTDLQVTDRALVGIGGGKDSIVAAKILKKNHYPFCGLVIDAQCGNELLQTFAAMIAPDTLTIKRQIDQRLITLNKQNDVYNGHVPISAINAAIGVLAAVLYDYKYVIVGNEKSADYGNVEYLGSMINHQWSKSSEFEKLFCSYVEENLTNSVTYFSLLRPYSELRITQLFAQYPDYFKHFTSCNRNFSITKSFEKKWCCACPKCAFVFVMLSSFLKKDDVIQIFGENLLDKISLINTYKELLGIKGIKPFECVGTPDEVVVAFYLTYEKHEFDDDLSMKMFMTEVLPELKNIEQMKQDAFATGDISSIPEAFRNLFE